MSITGQLPSTHRSLDLVAFQGELGAFSHAAAQRLFNCDFETIPCPSFKEVFEALESSRVTHAVIPIENTLHGSVYENYDYLLEYGLFITREVSVRIEHHAIAPPGVKFEDLRRVYSHPVALNQCRRFLHENPQIQQVSYYDTAGSVKMIMEGQLRDSAAIASETAAQIYGGEILKRNIEDNRENFTRFFLLAKHEVHSYQSSERWKTSLVFSIPNVPGALFKAVACFALRDLSLTKIESRPLRGKPWEYLFYLDVIGHQYDSNVKSALENLGEISQFVKILGSYTPAT